MGSKDDDCCFNFMRVVLVILNVIVLGGGGTAVGLGAWSLASDYGAKELKAVTGTELYLGGCVVVIVGGSIIFLVSVAGCCGALHKNSTLLNIYIGFISTILLLFIAGAIVGFIFKDSLEKELTKQMEQTLLTVYNVSYSTNEGNKLITDVWNKIQSELKCCGVKDGGADGGEAWRLYRNSSFVKQQINDGSVIGFFAKITGINVLVNLVPPSCCVPGKQVECQVTAKLPKQTPQELLNAVADETGLYKVGCVDAIEKIIMANIAAIAGIAVALAALMVIALIFSCYVSRNS